MKTRKDSIILGAGMTGLAAGIKSGFPIFEAKGIPGGICSSYYIRPGENNRSHTPPEDQEAYRFELGGGHWIFGKNTEILAYIEGLTALKQYQRVSSVYFREKNLYVPYPLQNNLRFLPQKIIESAVREIKASALDSPDTMSEWLHQCFGTTLCNLFFYPFHELYTTGLYPSIAPQDAYKSPVDRDIVLQGASTTAPPVGYNATFTYPRADLFHLAQSLAESCDIYYQKNVVKIDIFKRIVYFADGSEQKYQSLISTLPLNKMLEFSALVLADIHPAPYTSVLVLNIGAKRGSQCPNDHWLYHPTSVSGFHRVGFYSNVDASFLPLSSRKNLDRVSIYVERAYPGGQEPSAQEKSSYAEAVIKELQEWKFIAAIEVLDPTWIDVAYTWQHPNSKWQKEAIRKLAEYGIHQIGRYGRWKFQGIADSIQEGLLWGEKLTCANR